MGTVDIFTIVGILVTIAVALSTSQWRINRSEKEIEQRLQGRIDQLADRMLNIDRALATVVANAAAADRLMSARLEPVIKALGRIEDDLRFVRRQVRHEDASFFGSYGGQDQSE